MFSSIIFLMLIIAAMFGIAIYPKEKNELNGIVAVILIPLILSGFLVLSSWVSLIIWGRISISVISVELFILNLPLWAGIIRRKEKQNYFWRSSDIIGLILVAVFVLSIAVHVYGLELSIRYSNPVGAGQFLDAMNLLRGEKGLQPISFSSYIQAIFVGTIQPFAGNILCYKGFIVAEIFLRLLEAGLFYGTVLMISERKVVRYAAPVVSICYFFGYPALSLQWANYDYWNAGALVFLWIVYILLVIERKPQMCHLAIILLIEALLVDIISVQYYAAFHMVGVVAALLILGIRVKGHIVHSSLKYISMVGCILFIVIAGGLFYFEFFVKLGEIEPTALEAAGMYRCMYGDLLFFLPALCFLIVYVWRRKKKFYSMVGLAAWSLTGTIILYILWYQDKLDTYFYFLNYYNLWLLGWILVTAVLEIMAETKQLPIFFSYVGMIVALAVLTLTNYDYHMWHHNVQYNGMYVTKNFFPLYRQNMDALLRDYSEYEVPENIFTMYEYLDAEQSGKTLRSITESEVFQYLFDAFVGGKSELCRLDKRDFPDIIKQLETDGADVAVVIKDEAQYQMYQNYYEECDILYENDGAIAYVPEDGDWMGVRDTSDNYIEQKEELFSQALTDVEDIVPLMASADSYMDFILYEDVTGKSMEDFYTWKYSPVDNLHNLNAHGVKRIVVLKDDEYYQTTKDYFERHKVIYENEAGYILECEGTEWSTTY